MQQRRIACGSVLSNWPVHAVFTVDMHIVFCVLYGSQLLLTPMLELIPPHPGCRNRYLHQISTFLLPCLITGICPLCYPLILYLTPRQLSDRWELARGIGGADCGDDVERRRGRERGKG